MVRETQTPETRRRGRQVEPVSQGNPYRMRTTGEARLPYFAEAPP
jgi:hypothetical protein